jgi:hypothetical protein
MPTWPTTTDSSSLLTIEEETFPSWSWWSPESEFQIYTESTTALGSNSSSSSAASSGSLVTEALLADGDPLADVLLADDEDDVELLASKLTTEVDGQDGILMTTSSAEMLEKEEMETTEKVTSQAVTTMQSTIVQSTAVLSTTVQSTVGPDTTTMQMTEMPEEAEVEPEPHQTKPATTLMEQETATPIPTSAHDLRAQLEELLDHNTRLVDLLKTSLQIQYSLFSRIIRHIMP